jgi:hypothetical protein
MGTWLLAGSRENAGDFRLTLTDTAVMLTLANDNLSWTTTDDLATALQPSGSGGLFPALHLWRRLAVEGLERFGQVYYLGTMPLVGHPGLVDVLVGLQGGVECRFYFDPSGGQLLAMEMFSGDDVDPCELLFSEYREAEGRMVPTRIEARFGDEVFAVFHVRTFKSAEAK